MSEEMMEGLGLAIAAAAVGAVAASIKGISQQYKGGAQTAVWLLGFTVGMLEGVFDSWALRLVSSNVDLSVKGFGVLFSAIMGVLFAGEKPQMKQYIASTFLVAGPLIIAYASMSQTIDGMWCPIQAGPEDAISFADLLTKATYFVGAAFLVAGYVFKMGNTGGVADFRVLGWILWASIFHTLQATRIHEYNWDPFKDMMYLDHDTWQITGLAAPDRLQVSYGVLAATVLFQTAETLAFKNAGVVGPVHAAYIGTLILDALMHDMGNGHFASYTCTQFWIMGVGAVCCLVGACFAASIKHGHGHGGGEEAEKNKKKKESTKKKKRMKKID